MEENNRGKELLDVLKVLTRMNADGYKVSREINTVLAALMISFDLNKDVIDNVNKKYDVSSK